MRRFIAALLLVLLIPMSILCASDWHFFADNLDQHPEILWGFLPTYIHGGVGYRGFELIEDRVTDITLIVGGGYIERRFWIDPEDGVEKHDLNPLTFDVAEAEWGLEFSQGFFQSPVPEKDFLTVSVGYEGRYELALDSRVTGKTKQSWGTPQVVESIADFFAHASSFPQRLYPDLKGSHQYLGTNFYLNFRLDAIVDTISRNDGYRIDLNIDWSPLALNGALDGRADFYQITLDAVGAVTLYQYRTEKMNWFSIALVDRVRVNWLSGEYVPTYAQKLGSLGRIVRGYANYTYGTEFYIVNNLDLRFSGPDLGVSFIVPRINLFFDVGYGAGRYFNTERQGSNILASTGAQFTVSFFDYIDLGYQVAYLIGDGRNFAKGDTRFSGSVTFFLDF